jgi:hypothetical protein
MTVDFGFWNSEAGVLNFSRRPACLA